MSAAMVRGRLNRELCGEGFRDMRGLIICKGCGLKFRSGADLWEHAKGEEVRRNRQMQSKHEKGEPQGDMGNAGSGDEIVGRRDGEGGKMGVVEQIAGRARKDTDGNPSSKVSMPGHAAVGRSYPGTTAHSMPASHRQHPGMVAAVPQQLLQQQQQLQQQQLAFQQQQQLLILRQQQQAAPYSMMQHHQTAPPVLQQLPAQQMVTDRDRQIALLEKELRVQKMMMEVERREAMVREQATLLSVQAERMKQEQQQVNRGVTRDMEQSVLASRINSNVLEQAWMGERGEVRGGEAGGSDDTQVGKKIELQKMFQQMEKARKEEVEKVSAERKGFVGVNPNERNFSSVGQEIIGEKQKKVDSVKIITGAKAKDSSIHDIYSKPAINEDDIVRNGKATSYPARENYFPKNDPEVFEGGACLNDEAAEQLKILKEIKLRNEERRKQEEMSLKLISKLSLAEGEQQPVPDAESEGAAAALSDSWPDLSTAAAGETVRQKIVRLKMIAERKGMSVNSVGEGRDTQGGWVEDISRGYSGNIQSGKNDTMAAGEEERDGQRKKRNKAGK